MSLHCPFAEAFRTSLHHKKEEGGGVVMSCNQEGMYKDEVAPRGEWARKGGEAGVGLKG